MTQDTTPAAVAGAEDQDTQPEVTEPGRPAALDKDDQTLAGGDPAPKEAQTSLD